MLHRTDPRSGSESPEYTRVWEHTNGRASRPPPAHIAVLVKNFQYGGTQRVLLRLANKLHQYGHRVQVVSPGDGPLLTTLSDGIERVQLAPGSRIYARLLALRANPGIAGRLIRPLVLPLHPVKGLPLLRPLANYLAEAQPGVLISATASLNVVATLAKRRAGVPTALVLTEHVSMDQRRTDHHRFARRHLPDLMRSTYVDASAVVGVSSTVADELRRLLPLPPHRIRCIYNPAVPDDIEALAAAPVQHPWFAVEAPPVVLSAGRPGRTKDFATLVRAFAQLRAKRPVRLVVLSSAPKGSPQLRQLVALRSLAQELGVADDFAILEFTPNPFKYMARAGVFVSSSTSEGFGNVVAEALACGCPVVSTRTEGPAEVLGNGRFGRLVPVCDPTAMAAALEQTLQEPRNSPELAIRAGIFSEERASRAYEALCREVCVASPSNPSQFAAHASTHQ